LIERALSERRELLVDRPDTEDTEEAADTERRICEEASSVVVSEGEEEDGGDDPAASSAEDVLDARTSGWLAFCCSGVEAMGEVWPVVAGVDTTAKGIDDTSSTGTATATLSQTSCSVSAGLSSASGIAMTAITECLGRHRVHQSRSITE
jgi:hypothetical protein